MSSRRGYRISVTTSVRQSSLTPGARDLYDGWTATDSNTFLSKQVQVLYFLLFSCKSSTCSENATVVHIALFSQTVFCVCNEYRNDLPLTRAQIFFKKHIHYWEIIYFNLEDIFTIRYEDLHRTVSGLVIKRKGSRLKSVSSGAGSLISAVRWQAGNCFSRFPFLHLHSWCEDNNPGALGLLYNKR